MAWKRPLNTFDDPRNQAEMKKRNPENFNVVLNSRVRPLLGIIHIFSVARREFPCTHWAFPSGRFKGCKNGERYVECFTIPDPVTQISPDLERGGSRTDEHDAWRVAIDMLNPGNTTDDPWADTALSAISEGCNLIRRGLFPSRTPIPTEADLLRAEAARNAEYERLTQRAIEAESTSTRELNDFLKQHPEVHDAMDALSLSATWHRPKGIKVACPNCGEFIPQGIAFHVNGGIACVLDPERAFKAGAITKERFEELKTALSPS